MPPRRAVLAMALSPLLPPPATVNATVDALTVFEMRHYVTRPGRRDELIALFESQFLDAYEAAGATVLTTCRNLDAPDRWWWVRAFPSLAAREATLTAFYGGAVWRAHADACNATLADVGDARLLRPVDGDVLVHLPARPTLGDAAPAASLIEVRIVALASLPDPPRHPRRPLRTGSVFVTLTRIADASRHRAHVAAREASVAWRGLQAATAQRTKGSTTSLRLAPTARSALR